MKPLSQDVLIWIVAAGTWLFFTQFMTSFIAALGLAAALIAGAALVSRTLSDGDEGLSPTPIIVLAVIVGTLLFAGPLIALLVATLFAVIFGAFRLRGRRAVPAE